MHIMVVVHRQANLLQIVFALRAPGRFTCLLNGWQQQGNQDRNDGNDHQQLNQCKTKAFSSDKNHS